MTIDSFTTQLRRLASLRQNMKSAAAAWRASQVQVSVQHGIEFSQYPGRLVFELFFEISASGGKSLCWWIDLETKNSGIDFEATLRRNDGNHETQVWERSAVDQSVDNAMDLTENLVLEIGREASAPFKLFESL